MASIIRNSIFSALTTGSRFVANSLLFIIMARALGVESFGAFSFAVTFATVFLVVVDYGFNLLIIREVASNNIKLQLLSSNIINAKIILSFICTIIIIVTLKVMKYQADISIIIYIIWLGFILYSFGLYFNSILKGRNLFEYEAYSNIVLNTIQFISICILLYLKYSIIYLALAYLVARIIYFVTSYYFYKRNNDVTFFSINIRAGFDALITSFPFGITAILAIIFFQLDTILLSYIKSTQEVGYYQAPMKLLIAATLINEVITSAFYPILVNKFRLKLKEFNVDAIAFNKYQLLLGSIISSFLFIYADSIITIIFGVEYIPSIYILRLLSIVIFIKFASSSYALFITIADQQSARAIGLGLTLILNVFLNLIFIPRHGAIGAAYANIITQIVLYVLLIIFSYRSTRSIHLDRYCIYVLLLLLLSTAIQFAVKPYSFSYDLGIFLTMSIILVALTLNSSERAMLSRILLKPFRRPAIH